MIAACLALMMALSMAACKASDKKKTDAVTETTTETDSTFPDELLDTKDLAFTASCENGGPFAWGTDYWTRISYYVYYNGIIEIKTSYTLSGESDVEKEISYIDLKRIRTLADDFRKNRSQYDLDYSNCYDMDSWSFATYDVNGSRTSVYGGYTVGITELVGIQNTLAYYEDKETTSDRAYDLFEGKYVCPDDNQQYVSLYKTDGQVYLEVKPAGQPNAVVYEISDIELNDGRNVIFSYVQDNMWHYISYSYSADKTMIQDLDTSVVYNKQAGDPEGES
ncbi:MAG: hypothetical protein J5653_05735 [Clostridiales bacterium]|nr:hypothetical protein [Clostridiales bacterium]